MEKIIQYIKHGKGYGFLFLLAAAVIVSFLGLITLKHTYGEFRPQLMLIADEFLPITVKDGKIVEPIGVYKKLDLKFGDNENNKDVVPVVLDTRAESSEVPSDKLGIFIMTDIIYMVTASKIDRLEFVDGKYDKVWAEDFLNKYSHLFFILATVLVIGLFFIIAVIKTLIVAWVEKLIFKNSKKPELTDFSLLMRLSAVLVAGIEIIMILLNFATGISIGNLVRILIVILLGYLFLNREEQQEI